MDVDRPRLDEAILTPDEVEQLVSTEDTPGLRHERTVAQAKGMVTPSFGSFEGN